MSYLGSWSLSRAQGELVVSQYAQMICFFLDLARHSVVRTIHEYEYKPLCTIHEYEYKRVCSIHDSEYVF